MKTLVWLIVFGKEIFCFGEFLTEFVGFSMVMLATLFLVRSAFSMVLLFFVEFVVVFWSGIGFVVSDTDLSKFFALLFVVWISYFWGVFFSSFISIFCYCGNFLGAAVDFRGFIGEIVSFLVIVGLESILRLESNSFVIVLVLFGSVLGTFVIPSSILFGLSFRDGGLSTIFFSINSCGFLLKFSSRLFIILSKFMKNPTPFSFPSCFL